ncbi:membrane protein [Brevibacillus agri]|uniref:DMT family transporter n=1 Tax=Brevibacillus agri TaxID=51101 RepID=A0A3M8ALW0_9BACL|nr:MULTISPECIES: DMT family transporter [Brevibacillus]MCG5254108.1 DMT family transporter [Brevibacillus agri]MDR9506829.1 DMT family transporter [Brevibacillus agri]QAV15188.1 EamA/RhaT family transporter [Brevibacillus agri]QHZ57851.1 DMT family transporter [Brevibacillus sp. NSP2.1]RNB52019.1 DMT family transporter [Brevibacillus agri]
MNQPLEKPLFPPYLALLIGVIAISSSAIFVKLSSAPAPIIATYRLIFSVVLTLPFLLWNRGALAEIGNMSRKVWLLCLLSGAFLASHFLLWFESLNYTSVASSTVLVTLQPLFAFIGGYFFFGERVRLLALSGGLLAIAGSFVIGWGDFQVGGMALFGDALALLGAVTVTGYWLVGQYVRQHMSSFTYTLVVYTATSVILVAYDLVLGYPLVGYPAQDWGWFFCLALFPTLLGHSIFNWVIKWLNTTTISMGILGEPIGTAILAYFILGEVVTVPQWVGGLIIIAGIYLFIRYNQPAKGVSQGEQAPPTPKKLA